MPAPEQSRSIATTIESIEQMQSAGEISQIDTLLKNLIANSNTLMNRDRQQFESRAFSAVLVFQRDPLEGIELARALTPKIYDEHRDVALLLAYMYQTLGDCGKTIDALSSFTPSSEADKKMWSQQVWTVLAGPCGYRNRVSRSQTPKSRAWWELAEIAQETWTPDERTDRYELWTKRNHNHLAVSHPPSLFQPTEVATTKLALLLPQSGPLASAARAIRNGFLSAHLFHGQDTEQFEIQIVDSESAPISGLIDNCIAEGVDVIVGPLDKDRVRQIVNGDTLRVPIVALNRVAETTIKNTSSLQMAIVVEDDAKAMAKKLVQIRASRVLLVVGNEFWSARASVAFKYALDENIQIVDEVVLNDLNAVTGAVAELLHVAQSNRRYQQIQESVRQTLDFTARRRQDIDALVAFVDHTEFASLTAALQYHFAGEIPLLVAEPTLRTRKRGAEYASDTLITSIPARIFESPISLRLLSSFDEAEVLFPLYSFGVDAYRVAMNLNALQQGNNVLGLTGVLSVREAGVISRTPIWGTLKDQAIVPAPPVVFPIQHHQTLL